MEERVFGLLPDGDEVREVVIAAGDLTVTVISHGAVVRDIRLTGVAHPLVLGFDRLEDYLAHSPYFGAVAGRCANRIGGGRFEIDGTPYKVPLNENGVTHLHGGAAGFGKRPWRILEVKPDSVSLTITSADGDQGYPGEVEAICRYRVEAPSTLMFEAEAVTTRPTLVNLAQHSYFNLDDSADILDHEVQMFADRFTPTDDLDIPTGEIRAVAGSDLDFRSRRPIRLMREGEPVAYDQNFVTAMTKSERPRRIAVLRSPPNRVTLEVSSTEAGVQFYTGHKLDVPVPGLGGRRYRPFAGCCFEPQFFPDAVNHPGFQSPILRPHDRYTQTSRFAFGRG